MRERKIDAVVTVGTGGDKMFWGRLGGLARRSAGDPVGLALDRPARPCRASQPIARADHRRLHRLREAARRVPRASRRLPAAQGVRHSQRRRRRTISARRTRRRTCASRSACRPARRRRRSSRRCGPRRITNCFSTRRRWSLKQLPQAAIPDHRRRRRDARRSSNTPTQLGIADSVHFLGTRSDVPRAAVAGRRAGAQFAHGSQPGLDPGRAGLRQTGRGDAGRLDPRDRASRRERLPGRPGQRHAQLADFLTSCCPTGDRPGKWAPQGDGSRRATGRSIGWSTGTRILSKSIYLNKSAHATCHESAVGKSGPMPSRRDGRVELADKSRTG